MKFLLIDNDPNERDGFIHQLERDYPGVEFERVGRSEEFKAALARGEFDLAWINRRLDWAERTQVLQQIQERRPGVPVIMVAESAEKEQLVQELCGTFPWSTAEPALAPYLPFAGRAEGDRTWALARANALLQLSETLNRIDTLLSSVRNVEVVLPRVLAEAAAGLHADAAAMIRREKDCWVVLHVHGLPKELLGRVFGDEEVELSVHAAREKHVLLVEDIEHDPRFQGRLARKYGLRSLMVVPLLWQGQVLGVLALGGATQSLSLGPIQADFGRKLAASISLAQENARLYELARRDAETKAVLLREVNHRVKNNLAAIIGLLYMQRDRPGMKDQPDYQAVIRDLIHWTEGLSIAQGMLSESEWAPLRLDELASQVMRSCFQSLPRGRLVVQVRPSSVVVSAGQAHSLALVINELALNVAKHTLNGREEGQITVEAGREGREVVLTLRDDGPGYPAEVLAREQSGVGLGLVNKLICRNLRGRLTLRNEGGAVAEVRFPEQAEAVD